MKAKEIMTTNPKACSPTTTLADAARFMWDYDCGILPAVIDGGKVVGLITDRDICMAAAIQNRNLSNIAVDEVYSGDVYSCKPEDDVRTVLLTMREKKVRRLAVIDDDGILMGMLSMNDIVRKAGDAKKGDLKYEDIVNTYKAICERPLVKEKTLNAGA